MHLSPISNALGAEITGVDLRDPAAFPAIRDAFARYAVIVLRDQTITPDDHLAFARRWGEIDINRFFTPVPGHPEIATVVKEADQKSAIGEGWHTDHSYDPAPAMGSILHAIEVPPVGGDTVFVSMAAAYDALSPRMQDILRQLSAWHSSRHAFGAATTDSEAHRTGRLQNPQLATQDALHPMVIRHPLSDRPGLYVNPGFTTRIDGLAEAESNALLGFLYDHCLQPEFQTRIRWRAGDVTMWDNRATWHKAINDYHGHRREMHRVTVQGVALTPG